jgi:hypothetical protein
MKEGEEYLIEELGRRHGFQAWRGANTLGEELFVWRFLLPGAAAPGWTPVRLDILEAPGAPRSMLSLWKGQGADELVQLEVVECPSRDRAHHALVRALWEFESPLVRRREEEPIGDVTFAFPGDTSMVFARGNLVVALRTASRTPAPVTPLARCVDAFLVDRTERVDTREAPGRAAVRAAYKPGQPEQEIPLELDLPGPDEQQASVKFFAPSGEVVSHEGRLVYRARQPGPQRLSVYVVTPDGRMAGRQIQVGE